MKPAKILIVEDETIVAKDIELKLKKMGHETVGAVATGEEAVEKAFSLAPDLVLMDIKLRGGMDGIEAASQIHARMHTPIIYLTALNDEATLQRAKITEPFAYIQKPITTRELHIAVEICLYKHAVQKELSIQLQRMTAMRLIDQAIIKGQDMQWTMHVILPQIASQLEVDATAVRLLNGGTFPTYFQSFGLPRPEIAPEEGQSTIARAMKKGYMEIIADLGTAAPDDAYLHWLHQKGFVAYIAYPLKNKNSTLGVLEILARTKVPVNAEWLDFLDTLAQQTAIAVETVELADKVHAANLEIWQSYNSTIAGFSAALELRDVDTHGHCQRVTDRTVQIASEMGLDPDQLDNVRRGALLHDIGKMGVPDHILLKPGPLTPEEWEVMRRHPVMAREMLSSVPFLQPALEIPLYHHERWDGSGYPLGLKAEQIPLAARIFAVVDVWDALLSDRSYRKAWDQDKALEYMRQQSGIAFDPHIVAIFLQQIAAV